MEVRQLRYAVLLAETLHFGRAAERAFISQPAFSQQIARLERELGTKLFDRSSNRVALTTAGRLLVERAERMLEQLEATEADIRDLSQGAAGVLRVGIFGEGAGELTPLILDSYMRALPHVKLTFEELSMTNQVQALVEEDVDVAILRPPIADPRLALHTLFTEPRVAVLPNGHPLTDAPSLSVVDLIDEPFVSAAAGVPDEWGAFWRCDHDRGTPGRISANMRSIAEGLAAVAYLGAVDTFPAAAARHYPYPGVCYVPLTDATPATVAVAQRRHDHRQTVAAFCVNATTIARDCLGVVPGANLASTGKPS